MLHQRLWLRYRVNPVPKSWQTGCDSGSVPIPFIRSPGPNLTGWSDREAVLPGELGCKLRSLQPDPDEGWPSHEVTGFCSSHEVYGYGSPARHPQQRDSGVDLQALKQQFCSLSSTAPTPSTVTLCEIMTLGWTNCLEYLESLLLAVYPCWQFLFELIND